MIEALSWFALYNQAYFSTFNFIQFNPELEDYDEMVKILCVIGSFVAYEVIWDFDAMLDDRGVANKKLAADYQGCRMGGIPLTYTNP